MQRFCCCCTKKNKKKAKDKRMSNEDDPGERGSDRTFGNTEKGEGKKKGECQDTFCIMENFYNGMTYMAVYDGHGNYGLSASRLANDAIEKYLVANKEVLYGLEFDEDVEKFFKKMCSKVQEKYHMDKNTYEQSGTCAIMVLIKGDIIYTANLGDSRAVVASCAKDETCALEVSIDHKPTRECEKQRILSSGGKIERSVMDDKEVGPYRVWKADEDVPGIAIARSFGDLLAHKIGVTAEPEVTYKELDGDDRFIVMGSDGVWDVMSSAEAVGFILSLPVNEKESAAKRMVLECKERWDLINEIKKKQFQLRIGNTETNKKQTLEKKADLEKSTMRDDITVVLHYLLWDE